MDVDSKFLLQPNCQVRKWAAQPFFSETLHTNLIVATWLKKESLETCNPDSL